MQHPNDYRHRRSSTACRTPPNGPCANAGNGSSGNSMRIATTFGTLADAEGRTSAIRRNLSLARANRARARPVRSSSSLGTDGNGTRYPPKRPRSHREQRFPEQSPRKRPRHAAKRGRSGHQRGRTGETHGSGRRLPRHGAAENADRAGTAVRRSRPSPPADRSGAPEHVHQHRLRTSCSRVPRALRRASPRWPKTPGKRFTSPRRPLPRRRHRNRRFRQPS